MRILEAIVIILATGLTCYILAHYSDCEVQHVHEVR
jgi:hypothetical protein